MQVLKVELEGVTTSFRYPHFMVGRQPSFPMPPPATIHGHIASVLGRYPDADSYRFAYSFSHDGSVDDYEHTWMTKVDRAKIKDWGYPANVTVNLNPTLRQIFYHPRLTLYLATQELEAWRQAFIEPRYPVLLGRSQDLASYRSVEIIELEERSTGYYDHTLLPWAYRPRVRVGQGLLLPRFVNPENRREVTWARFVALENRVYHPKTDEKSIQSETMTVSSEGEKLLIDPTSAVHRERQRILVWHSLRGEESETLADNSAQ
jgi:CRISPR-associated protein Cas5t